MIINGDARQIPLADKSVQCVVTSPPYFCLRDYGVDGQIGLEQTPADYVANLVTVFREVWRVLKDDGVLFLNLGDSYFVGGQRQTGRNDEGPITNRRGGSIRGGIKKKISSVNDFGLKPKDLVGIPWRVAFALQYDGWYLRSDIIWHKPNPMPESVTDRPTKSHEYIFLLTKQERYYYDAQAILELAQYAGRKDTKFKGSEKYKDSGQTFAAQGHERWPKTINTKYADQDSTVFGGAGTNLKGHGGYHGADGRELFQRDDDGVPARNKRSVWTIATQPYSEAHFATYPEKLVEPCILAGSRPGDIVLDPFSGSGTTGRVAARFGRRYVGIELNPEYIKLTPARMTVQPYMTEMIGA